MFTISLEDLHNIKPKCGKKSMVQVMVTYNTPGIGNSGPGGLVSCRVYLQP